jgi:galactose mutarotase-like enzyme
LTASGEHWRHPGDLVLRSPAAEVVVAPSRGCEIVAFRSLASGMDVLWKTPWGGRPPGRTMPGADTAEAWVEQMAGGWQPMLPNVGDAGSYGGVPYAFHGEASLAPWRILAHGEDRLECALDLFALPLSVRRTVTVSGRVLRVEESVRNAGVGAVELAWGQHVGFGADLLGGPVRVEVACRRAIVDERHDTAGEGLLAGAGGSWPLVPLAGDRGTCDLSQPRDGVSRLAYLTDLDAGEASVARVDGSLGASIRWDTEAYPYAALWQELGGAAGWPWYGRGRVIAIEPVSSWPAHGIARIAATTGTQRKLGAGDALSSWVELELHY